MVQSSFARRLARLARLALALAFASVAPFAAHATNLERAELRVRAIEIGDPTNEEVSATFPASAIDSGLRGWSIDRGFASLLAGQAFAGSMPLVQDPLGSAHLTLVQNGAGLFAGDPAGGAAPGVSGTAPFDANLCVRTLGFPIGACAFTMPFSFGGPVGTGTRMGFFATAGTPFTVSVAQAPFTTRTAVGGATFTPAISGMGTNQLTPDGAGQLTLVSPFQIANTTPLLTPIPAFVGIAELELHFVPEPGLAALLVWGAGWLAWRGAKHMRD